MASSLSLQARQQHGLVCYHSTSIACTIGCDTSHASQAEAPLSKAMMGSSLVLAGGGMGVVAHRGRGRGWATHKHCMGARGRVEQGDRVSK